MRKLITITASMYAVLVLVLVAFGGETDTEQSAVTEHSMTVIRTIENGSLIWTNSLRDPSKLVNANWNLPASTTNTGTVDHVRAIVTRTIGSIITTNTSFSPALVETNYYPSETVAFVTNTLYTGATTNGIDIAIDAGISGDIPQYHRILGRDKLVFTMSDTNDIPIQFSLEK